MIEKINFKLLAFEDEAHQQPAVIDLRNLMAHNGWKFIAKVIELNIRAIQNELNTNENLSKEENNVKKRELRFLRNLKKMPENQIKLLEGHEPELDDEDPYYQDVETLEKDTGVKVVDISPPSEDKDKEE